MAHLERSLPQPANAPSPLHQRSTISQRSKSVDDALCAASRHGPAQRTKSRTRGSIPSRRPAAPLTPWLMPWPMPGWCPNESNSRSPNGRAPLIASCAAEAVGRSSGEQGRHVPCFAYVTCTRRRLFTISVWRVLAVRSIAHSPGMQLRRRGAAAGSASRPSRCLHARWVRFPSDRPVRQEPVQASPGQPGSLFMVGAVLRLLGWS